MSENNKNEDVKSSGEKISEQENVKRFPKYTDYITRVDNETGETLGHFPLRHKGLGTGWIGLYQEAADMIADWNLPNEQYRVYLKLLAKLDFDNYLRISQKQLSQELRMKQPHVSRALKALENLEVIVEGPRAGLNKTYRLNPYIAHKGHNREDTIKTTDFSQLTLIKGGKKKVETAKQENEED